MTVMTSDLARLGARGDAMDTRLQAQRRDLAEHRLGIICPPGLGNLEGERKEIMTGSERGMRATEHSRSCEKGSSGSLRNEGPES